MPVELVFRPGIGAESPIWDNAGAMVWLDQLPLPVPLQAHLAAWAFSATTVDDDNGLSGEARRLYRQVESYLGDHYQIRWAWTDGSERDPFATY
jgi:hypothetical protein